MIFRHEVTQRMHLEPWQDHSRASQLRFRIVEREVQGLQHLRDLSKHEIDSSDIVRGKLSDLSHAIPPEDHRAYAANCLHHDEM